ncbi:alpha/beta hydrolase [Rhodopseudomonas sp. BR0C11]|nr:alpha/beta hydrolase [Rhodopseudomonas sp. BR0C11]
MSQKALIAAITSGLFTMLAVVLWPIASAKAEVEIVTEDFKIKSSTPGIELFVRNKRPAGTDVYRNDRTVLYVHGATLASELVFDLPVGGASWADDLARAGWDVWLVDVRGYGRSTWPEALRAPAENNPPVATTAEAVADFTSAADFIRAKRKIDSLQVIGWSWGGVISGAYAAANPDKVSSLVLVAPLWAFDKPVTAGPPKKAWQEWTLADSRARIQKGVPAEQVKLILPDSTVALWEKAVRDSQPEATGRTPELFRSPTGVAADVSWQAQQPYDAAAITARTLIIRGEWDDLTPRSLQLALFGQLKNAKIRELIEVPAASHFIIVENARDRLFDEVRNFLSRH